MNRFQNILAVCAGTPERDDVLAQAVALARNNRARLTVISAAERPRPAFLDDARRHVESIVPWLHREGVSRVETDVLTGPPHIEIVQRVMRESHDLVIVGAHGAGRLRELFLSSAAERLLGTCPCALWMMKPGRAASCANVVAAIDPHPDRPTNDDINAKILDVATSVARSDDAKLHVVHFWDVGGADGERLGTEMPRGMRQRLLTRHETARRKALDALIARCGTGRVAHELHLSRGQPEWHLADKARELSADVIVMGTASGNERPRLVHGSFTAAVLKDVPCSVLAVKPGNYRCPVALPTESWHAMKGPSIH